MPSPHHTIQIVYFGPPQGGKTTCLRRLWSRLPDRFRSRFLSMDGPAPQTEGTAETDEPASHFFDLLPVVLDTENGRVTLRLVAVPGHPMYQPTRRLLLRYADGVVFVADSCRPLADNAHSLDELWQNLRENGRSPDSMPLVVQLNKTDLVPPRTTVHDLARRFSGRADVAVLPSCAEQNLGVAESLIQLVQQVWPVVLHERNALWDMGLDAPTLAQLLQRRLGGSSFREAMP